jgi:exodeoxyribonuclease VII small subunit
MEKEKTMETAFEELDVLLGRMEDKDLPLEEAFKLYQEGTKLIAYCNASIDRVEKQIIELSGVESNDAV